MIQYEYPMIVKRGVINRVNTYYTFLVAVKWFQNAGTWVEERVEVLLQ